MTSFEEKVNQRLVDLGLSMPELAELVDWPEAELRALCAHGDPRCSELVQLGAALRINPIYFMPPVQQVGIFNQTGAINVQKIKIGKAAAHELAAQLGACRRALDLSTSLVAAQEEIINLLRGSYNRPN